MDYNETIFVSRLPIASQNMLLNENYFNATKLFYTSVQEWKKPQGSITGNFLATK
jgi:hypothetical protein